MPTDLLAGSTVTTIIVSERAGPVSPGRRSTPINRKLIRPVFKTCGCACAGCTAAGTTGDVVSPPPPEADATGAELESRAIGAAGRSDTGGYGIAATTLRTVS